MVVTGIVTDVYARFFLLKIAVCVHTPLDPNCARVNARRALGSAQCVWNAPGPELGRTFHLILLGRKNEEGRTVLDTDLPTHAILLRIVHGNPIQCARTICTEIMLLLVWNVGDEGGERAEQYRRL
jgi:hypothetical protein